VIAFLTFLYQKYTDKDILEILFRTIPLGIILDFLIAVQIIGLIN
jgi:hypothetical protein